MKNGPIDRRFRARWGCMLAGMILGALMAQGAQTDPGTQEDLKEPATWHVESWQEDASRLAMPLPPLAVVTANEASGETWQQSGEVNGTLEVVRKDFLQSFGRGGWFLDKSIPLGRLSYRSEITLWTRPGHRVMLMIWEKEVGKCAFAWGEAQ